MSIIIGKLLKIKPTLRRKLYVASSFIYLGAFLFLYMVPNTNSPTPLHFVAIIFFLIAMAFTFSVYFTCLTSSIPYLVHEDSLGTAWGVCGSVGAFAQSIIPLINTLILKSSPFLEISYERLTFIGTLICLAPVLFSLYIYSNREYNVLDQRLIDEV